MTSFLNMLISLNQQRDLVPYGFAVERTKGMGRTAAAFGGAPHQSLPGSEEPGNDSFSPRGEALSRIQGCSFCFERCRPPPKASPLREKLSENRLFGTDFLTDVGDAAPTGRQNVPLLRETDKHNE